MKRILFLLIILCCTGLMYSVNHQINSSANGTRVNGYYILEDFEGYDLDYAFPVNNASLSAAVKANPTNGTEKSIYLSGTDNDRYLIKNATLPTGKVLADFDSLFFNLYIASAQYKNLDIYINGTKVHSIGNLIHGTNINLGVQKIAFANLNQSGAATVLSNAGNEIAIGIGCSRMNGTTFYLDNIKLSGGGTEEPPANTYTATLNPGTGTCAVASVSEIEEGSGVTLPTASPSAKCGLTGYTFVGWASNAVSKTEVEPTLIPSGAWEIQENTTLYAVYTDGTVYNTNPSCSASLNGTITDGWLMIEDFENSDIDEAFSVYKAENSGAATTATVALDPTESSNQAVLFSNKNYGHYLQLDVSLPVNRTLGNYKKISFDVICPGGMGNHQTLRVGINQNLSDVTNNGGNSLTTWTNIERDFPAGFSSYSGLSTFTLEVGFRTGAKDYYIDNIKLQLDPGLLTGADQYASKLFSVFANTIHFSTTATDVRVVDLNGRILLHAENTTQIDLNRLNPGMYIIRAVVADNPVVEKFIKK